MRHPVLIHIVGVPHTNEWSYGTKNWSCLPRLIYFLEGFKYVKTEVDEYGKKKLVDYSSHPKNGYTEISLFDYFNTYKDVWDYISSRPACQESKYLRKQVHTMYI